MRNTPITDELARQFAGKRLSSREAGAVWSLCRDLERELAEVIKQRDALAEALKVTWIDIDALRHFMPNPCRKKAEQALAATKGGSDARD